MSVDGNWSITVDSPMGKQTSTATLKTDGGALTGSQTGPMGDAQITDGKVDGNKLSWKIAITVPMAMTIEHDITVDGDTMTGFAKAGAFGSFPLTGTRA